ncbi:MAG: enoyl-CoA hydratase/isomerase family protein [Acidimicrobiales bacterium]|nr:enoyl-CoA hydratase/isomerase family protein [Acidimicrobiales bacterium]
MAEPANEELVLLDYEGPVAIVTNNRPDRHNAASDAFNKRLWECFYEVNLNPDVRCVLWRGNGPSFSSGRDLKELGGKRDNDMSHFQHIERGHNWTQMLLTSPAPIVCALKGWTIGGMFERSLLCDLRIAGESARLWLSEIEHGVVPDSGGVARLFQMAGHGLAADLALTGRIMGAEEAFTHGIVSRVVPDDELDETGLELARLIASRPALTVKLFRRDLRRMANPLVQESMQEEALMQAFLYTSDDYAEFKAAKAEGRQPVYRNR